MELFHLKATKRAEGTNKSIKGLRAEDKIPAVLYGKNVSNMNVVVDVKELNKAIKQSKTLQVVLNLETEGEDARIVILQECQRSPVTKDILHADFWEVDTNREISTRAKVVCVGKSKGVEKGGLLQIIKRDLSLSAKVLEIPEKIEVDITNLQIGESIYIKDIPAPAGATLSFKSNFPVITCLTPRSLKSEMGKQKAEEEKDDATKKKDADKKAEGDKDTEKKDDAKSGKK